MPTFRTIFGIPPELGVVTATADDSRSAVELAWPVSAMVPAEFERYIVSRLNQAGEYEVVGEVADRLAPTFSDLSAPHGVPATYSVVASNGWAEGTPSQASATLAPGWWITADDDPSLRFELRYVDGYSAKRRKQRTLFEPLGRAEPLAISGRVLPPAGTITAQIKPADYSIFGKLVRAVGRDTVTLKSPFGDVQRVSLGDIDEGRGEAGLRTVSVAFDAIA